MSDRQTIGVMACVIAAGLLGLDCGPRPVPPTPEMQAPSSEGGSTTAGAAPALDLRTVPADPRAIGAREIHPYSVDLGAGEVVRVSVEQRGADIALAVLDPGGGERIVVDRPIGASGTERVSLLSAAAGTYRLEVRNSGGAGQYLLRVVDGPRPALPADHDRAEAERLFMVGRHLEKSSPPDFASAGETYRRAYDLAVEARDRQLQAIALARLGDCLAKQGQVDRAFETFERARPLLDETGEVSREAEVHNYLGMIERSRGRFDAALAHYAAADRLAEAGDNAQARVTALGNRAVVEMYRGEIDRALDAFREQRKRWHELGSVRGEIDALNRIGELYAEAGEFQAASEYLEESLALARRHGHRAGEATALAHLARVAVLRRELTEAQDLLERTRAIVESLDRQYMLAGVLNDLGLVYRLRGLYPQGLEVLETALSIYRGSQARRDVPVVLMHLAWVREGMGEPSAALPLYEEARAGYLAVDDLSGVASTHYGSARAEVKLGNLHTALDEIDAALRWVEDWHRRLATPALATSYLAGKQDYFALKIEILMRLEEREPGTGHAARALAVSEEARARALVESLVEAREGLRAGADPDLLAERRVLWQRIHGLEIAVAELREEPASGDSAEIRVRLRDLLAADDRLEARLRQAEARYSALTRPEPPSLAKIQQELLDGDSLLLVYSLGEERSYLWAIDHQRMTWSVLPRREVVEGEAQHTYDLLVRSRELRAAGPLRAALRKLGDRLLGPLTARPGVRRVVIVADGALHYLPFGVLPAPAGEGVETGAGEPLVARYEVVNLPSLTVLAELRRTEAARNAPGQQLAVIADPVYQPDDQRLPPGAPPRPKLPRPDTELAALAADLGIERFERLGYAHDEAEAILALTPPSESFAALGADASLATFATAPLRRFRYLHIATHSVIDDKHPQLSGLVLSLFDAGGNPIRGILRLHDLYDCHLPVDLVVLSACSTALGEQLRGEGLIGLTRGFMFAGAPRVVVSLWNVNDRATAELMRLFYTGLLREGRSPAAALRAAQESLRRERGWEAPFYWAGFELQGDWR